MGAHRPQTCVSPNRPGLVTSWVQRVGTPARFVQSCDSDTAVKPLRVEAWEPILLTPRAPLGIIKALHSQCLPHHSTRKDASKYYRMNESSEILSSLLLLACVLRGLLIPALFLYVYISFPNYIQSLASSRLFLNVENLITIDYFIN